MIRFVLWLALLSGCRDAEREQDSTADDSGSSETQGDMAETLGCNLELDLFQSVTSTATSIGSVPRIHWESSEEVQAYVVTDVGREDFLTSPVPETAALSGELFVLGIPYQRENWNMVVAQTDDGLVCSEPLYASPATLDPKMPELTLNVFETDQAEGGFTVLGVITDGVNFMAVVDEMGEYVWAKTLGHGVVSRAVFGLDGTSMLYHSWAERVGEPGIVYRVGFDGENVETLEITSAHTDFLQLPDGGLAAIGWDLRDVPDGEGVTQRVLGDSIVELDAEGNERVVWSVFDAYEPDLSLEYNHTTVGLDEDLLDWSHGNGLAYDEVEDDYLISLFGLGSLVRVDRQTGQTKWVLSDSHGDFSSANEDLLIQGTHSVEVLDDDRLLIFNRNVPNPLDDQQPGASDNCSEAMEIQLDPETGEASKEWSYTSDQCLLVVYFGEAIRLEGGNTLVIFSSSGQASETNGEGDTVWEIQTDLGGAFGFGDRRSSLY